MDAKETELTIPFGTGAISRTFVVPRMPRLEFFVATGISNPNIASVPEAVLSGLRPARSDVVGGIEACIPALRRYARTLLGDRQAADDLVHHCLILALERPHLHRESGDLRVRLFAIMHDLYVSQIRCSKVRVAAWEIAEMQEEARPLSQDPPFHAADLLRARATDAISVRSQTMGATLW